MRNKCNPRRLSVLGFESSPDRDAWTEPSRSMLAARSAAGPLARTHAFFATLSLRHRLSAFAGSGTDSWKAQHFRKFDR